MYFDLRQGRPRDGTLVGQEKSRKLVPAKTTDGQWCLSRTVVKCETVASSFSFGRVDEMIQVFL